MRFFSAITAKCDEYKRRAPIGIARASATRAAARASSASPAHRFLKQFYAVFLTAIGATLPLAAAGAHADSIKIGSTGLTLPQRAQIYSGTVTRWPDGSPIRLVVGPDSDADTIVMRAFSAEMNTAITAARARKGMRMADTDQDNADALEQLPGSLGTTTPILIRGLLRAISR